MIVSGRERILDDLSQLANGVFSTLGSAKNEVEAMMNQRLERAISELDVVTREEFEIVRDMAVAAREENQTLREHIQALEAKLTQ